MARNFKSKWQRGERIGQFTVMAEPVFALARKGRKLWIYKLRCNCGNEETLHQEQLDGGRIDCLECGKRRKGPLKWPTPAQRIARDDSLPDFARLPAPESVGKPDAY